MKAKNPLAVELSRLKKTGKLAMPTDLSRAIATSARARATWDDITPIMQRDWILWVITAKLDETRKRRIEKAIDMLSRGKRRVCCFGGMNWVLKTYK